MQAEDVIAEVERNDVELVRFLWVDHGGLVRGKAASRRALADRMAGGIGLTVAMQAMNMLDELQPVPGLGPVGEVRLVPDPETFAVLPYAPGAAAMVADMVGLDGQPWPACARTFLKQAIAELAGDGIVAQVAIEPEFTLGRRVPAAGDGRAHDRLEPVDSSRCFSTTGFAAAHDFAIEFVRALEAQGMEVEQYYPELGHGQQELSIRHAPALRAADNMVGYRETARGVAVRQGLVATFAPKPILDQAGNGAHVHLSLWDADRGHSLLHAADDPMRLSPVGYHFIGGLLAHLPALVALSCASVNSYRRMQPQMWAGAYSCFGLDNRESAVRIASPLAGHEEDSVNLEYRISDATGNPYLAIGAVLLAGLDGVRNKTDPGEPLDVDPATLDERARARRGVSRLPETLAAALDALERDQLLSSALGPRRLAAYLAVKRSEIASFAARDPDFECFAHWSVL